MAEHLRVKAHELRHSPEARAKASQVLEEQVKARAEQAWREAQPKIEHIILVAAIA